MYLEHRKDVGTLRKIRAFSTAFFIIIVTRFREYVRYRFWNNVFWLLDCVCFVFHALFLRKFHRETERQRERFGAITSGHPGDRSLRVTFYHKTIAKTEEKTMHTQNSDTEISQSRVFSPRICNLGLLGKFVAHLTSYWKIIYHKNFGL